MTTENFEGPEVEEQWCEEQRSQVELYLKDQKLEHGEIGEWPAWHFPPYVSIWAIESRISPGWVGWWVISGDMPTDYISAETIKHPREALKAFAKTWNEVSGCMLRGESHPTITIGAPEDWPRLGDLLKKRAESLSLFTGDDSLWEE